MRRRLIVASLMATGLLAACSASYNMDPDNVEEGTFERWGCGDHVYGCRSGGCPVKLKAYFDTGVGTVEVAGTVNATLFDVVGLERRWDWGDDGDGGSAYAIVLTADGTAQYYNFSKVMPDADGARRTKPSDFFRCHRLRK